MVGQRPKIKKKTVAKTPYSSTPHPPQIKRKKKGGGGQKKKKHGGGGGQNINDSISHIWNSFFEKKYFRHHFKHLYSSTRSCVHYQNFFIILDFLAENLKANKN